MAEYIFIYYGGEEMGNPEEQKAIMQEWNDWLSDLGDAVINPGTPLASLRVVSKNSISMQAETPPMNGFSIVKADNIDDAVKMVQTCPHLKIGGTIKVAECRQMPG